MRVLISIVTVFTVASYLLWIPLAKADDSEREGRIRAALVYSIMKFAESPKFLNSATLTVCLAGTDETTSSLPTTVDGKLALGKPVRVSSSDRLEECSVLFLAEEKKSKQLLRAAHTAGVLTICNTSVVEWDTCMIQLYQENNKARIAVDRPVLRAFGMKLHPDVLQLSLVRPEGAE